MEKVTVILGPTASGKTDFAIQLARKKKGAVISADSRQIYAGMNIGTATPPIGSKGTKSKAQNAKQITKAKSQIQKHATAHSLLTPDEVDGIPHYLLNIRKPNDPLTLADWQRAAYQVIEKILKDKQHPILAGGTMLYIDSVLFNYDIPNVQPNEQLRSKLEKMTAQALYTQLHTKDPDAIHFIDPQNKRRIIRALEVMEATNKTFSQLRRKRKPKYDFEITGLFPQLRQGFAGQAGWDELKIRIAKRAEQMLEEGLLEETRHLRKTYGKDLPLLKTMNYVQAAAVHEGSMDKKMALDEITRANYRYARRQMSWWRGRSDIRWITPQPSTTAHT